MLYVKRTFYSLFVLLTIFQKMKAQETEPKNLVHLDYTMVPSAGDVYWNQYELGIDYPFSIAKNESIGFLASYQNTLYDFFETANNLSSDSFEEVHTFEVGIFYSTEFSNSWRINVLFAPIVSSNLNEGLGHEDFQYSGHLIVRYKWIENNELLETQIGFGYGALFGKPEFYPIISLNGNWDTFSYSLGFPETNIIYDINKRHSLKAKLSWMGSYSNLSNDLGIQNLNFGRNSKLEYSTINLGAEYRYRLQPKITCIMKVGYLEDNTLQLLDNTGGLINDFSTHGSTYVTMGLTFNINTKLDENRN